MLCYRGMWLKGVVSMETIHRFEERILPRWWHQSNRVAKVIVVAVLLGILVFIQAFPALSLIAGLMLAVLVSFIAAVGVSLKWIVGQFR